MVYKYRNISGSISNVVATYGYDGSSCVAGNGASYFIAWEANQQITNEYHEMKIMITGGNTDVTYYPVAPIGGSGAEYNSGDKNDYAGNLITLVITWQLIEKETGIILQSGTVAGSPSSAIFAFSTNCVV